jgi:hypothetical protein
MAFHATAEHGQYQCPECGRWQKEYGKEKKKVA